MDKRDAKELIQWARADFERYRNEKDIVSESQVGANSQFANISIPTGKYQVINIRRQISNAQFTKLCHFISCWQALKRTSCPYVFPPLPFFCIFI